jgi:hypothetical protein
VTLGAGEDRAADPGRVLLVAILGWGLGHRLVGRRRLGTALLAAEIIAALLVAWLTVGLADSSLLLVPYLAGVAFLAVWAWQAIDAYRRARARFGSGAADATRSAATHIGWLSLPLLTWGAGFWLVAGDAASPSATLDRFVSAWTDDSLSREGWPASVVEAADAAAAELGIGADRFRDVRVTIVDSEPRRATAVAEAIHYERRPTTLLGLFAGSELVPIPDRRVLELELVARPVSLPGGGDIGAVQWELVRATH